MTSTTATTHSHSHVAHHFDDAEQQYVSAELGMWLFLATEILFFGGAFLGYTLYRFKYQDQFIAGSHHLDEWLGAINTTVLLTSSLTMVLAVHAAQLNKRGALILSLIATIILGTAFLGVKAYEYHHKYVEHLVPGLNFQVPVAGGHGAHGAAGEEAADTGTAVEPITDGEPVPVSDPRTIELFFSFYFVMTGIHAVHMVIGIVILMILVVAAMRGAFDGGRFTPIEMTGLYWHFVDIVWVFLFPLLYLIR